MRALGRAVFFLFAVAVSADCQPNDTGKQVYSSTEGSVFLVYLNNASGSPSALGSAFLVKPHVLVTNAHVAEAGSPVLSVGPVRLPLTVIHVDHVHDLATMSVEADLTSTPLVLSSDAVTPGEQIFAIGNPEGLEKSISQGIVAGLRKRNGNDLIQITSPISHGSSGGPVLNVKGEVVGVAVAFLDEGQNLNFAVPVEYVRNLLTTPPEGKMGFNPTESIDHISGLIKQRDATKWSDDDDSDYKKLSKNIEESIDSLLHATNDPAALQQIICFGISDWGLTNFGIGAGRKLVQTRPSSESQALLAYALLTQATSEELSSSFAKDGSDEQKEALARKEKLLIEAINTASKAAQLAHGDTLLLADYVLGSSKSSHGETENAIQFHTKVAAGTPRFCDQDLTKLSLQSLVQEYVVLKKPDESEKWFRKYSSLYEPAGYEWDAEGDRRADANDFATAAIAYESAAKASAYYLYDLCYAARSHYLQVPEDSDGVLRDGKECVEAAAKNTNKNLDTQFSNIVPYVYNFMADILERRGVYETALEYTKEAIRAKPDYAYAMHNEATIYMHQDRYSECVAVEKEAIRISEGKFPECNFG